MVSGELNRRSASSRKKKALKKSLRLPGPGNSSGHAADKRHAQTRCRCRPAPGTSESPAGGAHGPGLHVPRVGFRGLRAGPEEEVGAAVAAPAAAAAPA